jgi:hypothetical protein
MVGLDNVNGFEWDEGNRDKNWINHQVTTGECEEVFFNLPLFLQADLTHSEREARSFVLGHTNEGRYLFIVFTIRSDKIRVISARDMSNKERTAYGEANP